MLRKVIITITSLIVLGYISWAVVYFSSPQRSIGSFEYEGIEIKISGEKEELLMTESDVIDELRREQFEFEGKPLDSINIYSIEQYLRNNKLFSKANVYLTPKKKIQISLSQYAPLFLVMTDNNERYYVSVDRGVIPYYPASSDLRLVASGKIDTAMAVGKIFDLVTTIQESDYWRPFFSQIYAQPDSSLLLVPRVGDVDILIGKSSDWAPKLQKLKVFIDQVIPQTGWGAFTSINLAFKDQIVVEPTQAFAALQESKPKA